MALTINKLRRAVGNELNPFLFLLGALWAAVVNYSRVENRVEIYLQIKNKDFEMQG